MRSSRANGPPEPSSCNARPSVLQLTAFVSTSGRFDRLQFHGVHWHSVHGFNDTLIHLELACWTQLKICFVKHLSATTSDTSP